MPYYIVRGQSETATDKKWRGPVQAINAEEAVKSLDMGGYDDVTVWAVETRPAGEPQGWSKEELDL